jgi:hypothetical protein
MTVRPGTWISVPGASTTAGADAPEVSTTGSQPAA